MNKRIRKKRGYRLVHDLKPLYPAQSSIELGRKVRALLALTDAFEVGDVIEITPKGCGKTLKITIEGEGF